MHTYTVIHTHTHTHIHTYTHTHTSLCVLYLAGSSSIQSVIFDRNSTTLTCTSTGGPPTTVSWRKNNAAVNLSIYEQSQRLVDSESAMYENVLFNADIANFVGSFTCEVSNARGINEVTVELNGWFYGGYHT